MFVQNAVAISSFFEWGVLYADYCCQQFVTGLWLQVLLGMTYATWQ